MFLYRYFVMLKISIIFSLLSSISANAFHKKYFWTEMIDFCWNCIFMYKIFHHFFFISFSLSTNNGRTMHFPSSKYFFSSDFFLFSCIKMLVFSY